jgi:CO/xanthine dehydrogenase FAD-binding subunit
MRRPFQYLRPSNVEEAVQLKSEHGARAMFWAGGTDMMLMWRQEIISFDYCIDLSHLPELDYIDVTEEAVNIGPMTSLDTLDNAADQASVLEVLAQTAHLMCTTQTRTLATIGGNICRASPSADLAPPLLTLGASVTLKGPDGDRTLPLDDFFTGPGTSCCRDDELLVQISVPIPKKAHAASYQRVDRTVVDIALVGSAALLVCDGDTISDAKVALGAVAPTPIRANLAEEFLTGKNLAELAGDPLKELEQLAADCSAPISDQRSGAEYRRQMAGVLTRKAVENCMKKLEV